MGRIEADIALESWLFGFPHCTGQGQFTPSSLFHTVHLQDEPTCLDRT